MVDVVYWIWLSLVCNLNPKNAQILLDYFEKNPKLIFEHAEDKKTLRGLLGHPAAAKVISELDEAAAIKDFCIRNNVGLIPLYSEYYPKRLQTIKDRPTLLYYMGKLPDFDSRLSVTMVGTRSMTEYGKNNAYLIAYDTARAGAIVTSGMALGVDGFCHRGALDAGGHTIAVLGSGIDVVYPSQHKDLMEQIIRRGTVITEFKPTTPPYKTNFPIRNRILSGLSQATLVIEGDMVSGSMITARTALYQGRDIYALPGKVGELSSSGTNKLIREGAKMVTCAADLLNEYVGFYPGTLNLNRIGVRTVQQNIKISASLNNEYPEYKRENPTKIHSQSDTAAPKVSPDTDTGVRQEKSEKSGGITVTRGSVSKKPVITVSEDLKKDAQHEIHALTPFEKNIYDLIPAGHAVTADELSDNGIPVQDILLTLTMLESKGYVCSTYGGMYKKIVKK